MTTVTIHEKDGTSSQVTMSLLDTIQAIAGDAHVTLAAPGMEGTPAEIVAGDFLHVAASFGTGSQLPYKTISRSNAIPSTPPAVVPVFDPTGTAPITPMIVYDTGGATYNVKGDYNLLGLHSAGTILPAASTAEGGPYLPQKDALVMLPDSRIDFAGHGIIMQSQACFFGLCAGVGAILGGVAVAQFDATPIALPNGGALSTAFPILP